MNRILIFFSHARAQPHSCPSCGFLSLPRAPPTRFSRSLAVLFWCCPQYVRLNSQPEANCPLSTRLVSADHPPQAGKIPRPVNHHHQCQGNSSAKPQWVGPPINCTVPVTPLPSSLRFTPRLVLSSKTVLLNPDCTRESSGNLENIPLNYNLWSRDWALVIDILHFDQA